MFNLENYMRAQLHGGINVAIIKTGYHKLEMIGIFPVDNDCQNNFVI